MNKYTIKDFNQQFPDDNACLEYLFNHRFGKNYCCPRCSKKGTFHRVKKRRCYACANCAYQFYPTAGTVFHKSSTSMKLWFYAAFLMSQSKNGVSAKELERQLGVAYRTAWRMARQIKKLMSEQGSILDDTVEADETYIGGKKKGKRGRGSKNKTAVFGMVEREEKVVAKKVDNVKSSTVIPLLKKHVKIGTKLMTDEFRSYLPAKRNGYIHQTVEHGKKEYVRGEVHTNTIEGFWSQMKRSIDGTYHFVSPKYLQYYIDEFSFRYNHRNSVQHLFHLLLQKV